MVYFRRPPYETILVFPLFRAVFILGSFFFFFRRLNTLNKCASMKLDVNLPKKKVSVGSYIIGFIIKISFCTLPLIF